MNIQHLEYALEIARTGSISKAAENLYMGQPNLSKAIKELEDSLGFAIFTRTHKGAFVTAKGQEFIQYARNILVQLEKIESIASTHKNEVRRLKLSVPRSSYIADVFSNFVVNQHQEGIHFTADFRETNSIKTIEYVEERRSNLGIIRYQCEHCVYFDAFLEEKELEKLEIWEYEYMLLFSESHPLAKEEKINQERLSEYVEITHGDLSVPYNRGAARDSIDSSHSTGKKIYVYERGSQFDILSKEQSSYMWVSPMPEDVLKRNGLTVRPCYTGTAMKDMLIYKKGYQMSDTEELFLRSLAESVTALSIKSNAKLSERFIGIYG